MPAAKYIGNPAFRVHTQQGTLLRALRGKMVSTSPATFRVSLDAGIAPHAPYVVQGTRVMLGRDVIWSSMAAKGTQVAYFKAAVRVLGKGLRSQAAVRFAKDAQGSYRITILSMNNTEVSMHRAAVLATGAMGATALGIVAHNISLTDHTLQDLARMGHPYARRHGSIRIHN
jgi:hypothetical protein